ncbi:MULTISPECIES: hypothetical protein [Microbacterium]|nr:MULTISPECIES: hypothetical protein [Microbacterium]MDQ1074180.1 hypothetical protein [Microbacterium sp. SORGH_AS_0969]MDQ1114406.1 hypothetical protein [Microbacterium testaceum]
MTCARPTFAEISEWVTDYEKQDRVAHATVHVLPQEAPRISSRESSRSI